jgi:hypothetical protein
MSFRMQVGSAPVLPAADVPKPSEPTPAQLQKQVMELSAQLADLKKQVSSGSLVPKPATLNLPGGLSIPGGLNLPLGAHVARSPAASPRYGSRP